MSMPINLLFVRHGESEQNVLQEMRKKKIPLPNDAILEAPDYAARLTPRGVEQAQAAGKWIRENIPFAFDAAFVSPYVRPMETAGHMRLGLEWRDSAFLVERNWGVFDLLSEDEQHLHRRRRRRNPLYHPMAGGESLADTFPQAYLFFSMLHREHSEHNVVAVAHGEKMLAIRFLLERMSVRRFEELWRSKHDFDQVNNCQILHYTRMDPESGELSRSYRWMRSICPWDLKRSSNVWQPIVRKKLSDEELLEEVGHYPRYLS